MSGKKRLSDHTVLLQFKTSLTDFDVLRVALSEWHVCRKDFKFAEDDKSQISDRNRPSILASRLPEAAFSQFSNGVHGDMNNFACAS